MAFRLIALVITFVSLAIAPQTARAEIRTVPNLDLVKFMGTWYEIARNPSIREAACTCSREILSLRSQAIVDMVSTCNRVSARGPMMTTHSVLKTDASEPGKLSIDYGLPVLAGDYWVIALDTATYQWAVVTDRHQRSLQLLARTPTMDEDKIAEALKAAGEQVDTTKIKKVKQDGCTYDN